MKEIQIGILGLALVGTLLLFYNSPFATELSADPTLEDAAFFFKRNRRKKRRAQIGMGLMLLSYLLQAAVVFF